MKLLDPGLSRHDEFKARFLREAASALQAIDQPLNDLGARCQSIPEGTTPGQ